MHLTTVSVVWHAVAFASVLACMCVKVSGLCVCTSVFVCMRVWAHATWFVMSERFWNFAWCGVDPADLCVRAFDGAPVLRRTAICGGVFHCLGFSHVSYVVGVLFQLPGIVLTENEFLVTENEISGQYCECPLLFSYCVFTLRWPRFLFASLSSLACGGS